MDNIKDEVAKWVWRAIEDLQSEYELTDDDLPIELFEGAKNIRLPEHKSAYPKSINKEP